jgi:hypothetical protein
MVFSCQEVRKPNGARVRLTLAKIRLSIMYLGNVTRGDSKWLSARPRELSQGDTFVESYDSLDLVYYSISYQSLAAC